MLLPCFTSVVPKIFSRLSNADEQRLIAIRLCYFAGIIFFCWKRHFWYRIWFVRRVSHSFSSCWSFGRRVLGLLLSLFSLLLHQKN